MSTDHPPRGPVARLATGLALLGGVVLLAVAGLTTVSVLLRWLTSQPVRGDVELVSVGSGLAVLGFLAFGTLMRANILVDSFTTRLPRRVNGVIDGFWSVVWAAVVVVLGWRMLVGAREALATHTTTIGLLGIPIWWAVGIGAVCFVVTALPALLWASRFLRGRF